MMIQRIGDLYNVAFITKRELMLIQYAVSQQQGHIINGNKVDDGLENISKELSDNGIIYDYKAIKDGE